jgi:hypothetical protein
MLRCLAPLWGFPRYFTKIANFPPVRAPRTASGGK